ncbi:unnamed protein product [Pedinophyceae sp. YPF-701]|nr:unnamed protein product [Pedinophyceae sp. YPF-701]
MSFKASVSARPVQAATRAPARARVSVRPVAFVVWELQPVNKKTKEPSLVVASAKTLDNYLPSLHDAKLDAGHGGTLQDCGRFMSRSGQALAPLECTPDGCFVQAQGVDAVFTGDNLHPNPSINASDQHWQSDSEKFLMLKNRLVGGVALNGKPVPQGRAMKVKPGDIVKFGDVEYQLLRNDVAHA